MIINVPHQEGGFSLFYLLGIVFRTSQPVLDCYGLFRVVPFFTSNDATECFDLQIYYKSTSYRFYYKKDCKRHYKKGHLKVG